MDDSTTLRVVLGIPWRPTPDRVRAYDFLRPKLDSLYPWYKTYTGDSGDIPFRRGATRNYLVRVAESYKADVVVLCDADSLPEPGPLADAIRMAAEDNKIHFPFHQAWYMEQKVYARIEAGQSLEQLKSRIIDKCATQGGCWVMTPQAWWACGGMDDRLIGWGGEDRAFLAASNTILGAPVIHHGILLCLPHLPDDHRWLHDDVVILNEYHERYQQPERMKEYIESRVDVFSSVTEQTEER